MLKAPNPGCRGFSLIELTIVLIIMGLLIAMAGPRIAKGLTGLTIKTTAKKIAGTMRYARSRAVSSGDRYSVIFDAEKNRVIVVRCLPPKDDREVFAADNATEEERPPEEEGVEAQAGKNKPEVKIYPLPENVTFERITVAEMDSDEEGKEGIYQMAFYPNGTAQPAEVIITDPAERQFRISVDFITGSVFVEDLDDEDDE